MPGLSCGSPPGSSSRAPKAVPISVPTSGPPPLPQVFTGDTTRSQPLRAGAALCSRKHRLPPELRFSGLSGDQQGQACGGEGSASASPRPVSRGELSPTYSGAEPIRLPGELGGPKKGAAV